MYDLKNYIVTPADEWTKLFKRTSGWFGGDGIFSFSMNGVESGKNPLDSLAIYFSDTFIGDVVKGKPQNFSMVHNSLAKPSKDNFDKQDLTFYYRTNIEGKPTSFFKPKVMKEDSYFFWLGDGFVNIDIDSSIYIFAYHVQWTGKNVFDFTEPGVSILKIKNNTPFPFKDYQQMITPFHLEHPSWGYVNLGAGIYVNTDWAGAQYPDGFIYVYGCMDKDKKLVVARVKSDKFESFTDWEYWDGKNWQDKSNNIAPITNNVSNELSVTPLNDGRYLLVFQFMGISDTVACRVGASPWGPFGDIIELYKTPESANGLLTYNAKAHPVLSDPNKLLISYNTISYDFWNDIKDDAHIYRPRFIRLEFL